MPNCPDCHFELAVTFQGGICMICKREFSPMAIHKLPDYNYRKVQAILEQVIMLIELDLVQPGYNQVIHTDGGIILQHLTDED